MKFLSNIYRPDAKVGQFLWVLALSGIAYGLYRGIQDNYLSEMLNIDEFERGIVEFFRETPGLLVMMILALMYRFSATRIFKIGLAFMTAGLAGMLFFSTSFTGMKFVFVIFMVVFSTGEHINMPIRTTISLDLAKQEKSGMSLGISSAIGQMGHIAGFLMVTGAFFFFSRNDFERTDILPYRVIFAASSALMILSVMISLAMKETTTQTKRRRFYFHKKFFKYYMLEVFYGARKQIFLTFGPYVLIRHPYYNADTSVISLLMAICAIFGFFFSPLVGKLIDRLGYKFIMVTDTLILIVVCLLYGFAHIIFPKEIAFIVVCANYILDSIISLGSMASNVYVQRIASNKEEVTATLSTGISVNHLISITIALMGGWIWRKTGIEVLFSLSAVLGIINSIYAATIKKSEEASPA
ncbi:MAG: MFS transporter [Treponema sp.]|jgi:MFS family permease|nr:MFS transporter [Treponema sp.]